MSPFYSPERSPDRRRSCERGSRLRTAARSDGPAARSSVATPLARGGKFCYCYGREVVMSKVENIEQEVRDLTPSELAAFRQWFLEFDAKVWDRQIEEDIREGRLDKIADEALASHRAGKSKEL
jgi:hypothetical protein